MNIILLSGGSGKRLWPLSNNIRSKQFLKLFKDTNGEYESMIQRMYRGISSLYGKKSVTVATAKTQVSAIHNQLGENVDISVEPARMDTFPAILLATEYLHTVKKIDKNSSVVICPVDPYIDEGYFKALGKLYELSEENKSNLTLMGIEPTYPSEKYGYIIPTNKDLISSVKTFKEKPEVSEAAEYIKKGALWNAGVFAFKLKYVIDIAKKYIDYNDYYDLYDKYSTLKKISFDYAVVEKEKNIRVLRYSGDWKDLGTWNTLSEAMSENAVGNAVMSDNCKNVSVVNELDIPVLCMGLEDVVISASPDGILVSDKENSSYIKPYVDKFEDKINYAEKSWGSYKVIDAGIDSITVKVVLNPGHSMNYHSHNNRDEIWTVISGKGTAVINGDKIPVKSGDILKMEKGTKHLIKADTELKIIEVQLGRDIDVKDKVKYSTDFE